MNLIYVFYYKKIIDFERDFRNQIEDETTLTAINMNLILCITCFLEGILEDRGHMILGYYNSVKNCVDLKEFEIRKAYNTINSQIKEFFRIKISQTTGIANFDNIFEIFLGKSFIHSKNSDKVFAFLAAELVALFPWFAIGVRRRTGVYMCLSPN